MIEQASRSRDQHVEGLCQAGDLRLHADAAEYHCRFHRGVFAIDTHALLDLGREFAGRSEYQHAYLAPLPGGVGGNFLAQLVQDWQYETGGLASAGLRAGEQIATLEHRGYRGELDRGGLGIAVFGDGAHDIGGEAERGEIH